MNVVVVTSGTAFVRNDADNLSTQLVSALHSHGVRAEVIRLPFSAVQAEGLIDAVLCTRSLRLSNVDRVIGLRFPAYLISHPAKVLWLHDYPKAPEAAASSRIRSVIHHADKVAFGEALHIYTATRAIAGSVARTHGFSSGVLPAPRSAPEWTSAVERLLS